MDRARVRYTEAGAALDRLFADLDRGDRALRRFGISRGRLAVLRALVRDGPQTVAALARARGASRQGVQRMARALVDEGWVRFQDDPNDRRAPRLHLTEHGERAYSRLAEREARELNRLARGLSADQLREASQLLRVLSERLDGRAGGVPD